MEKFTLIFLSSFNNFFFWVNILQYIKIVFLISILDIRNNLLHCKVMDTKNQFNIVIVIGEEK